jgi:hypothetical protein
MSGDSFETFDSLAQRFEIGSRARVGQIVKLFRAKLQKAKLSTITACNETIRSFGSGPIESLRARLVQNGLLEGSESVRGLLKLLQELDLLLDFAIYTPDLELAGRDEYARSIPLFIIDGSQLAELRRFVRDAATLPGQLGLARVNLAERNLPETLSKHSLLLRALLASRADSVIVHDTDGLKNTEWFMFENRENVLVNAMGKVKQLASSVDLKELADILERSLFRRTGSDEYPSSGVIAKYLTQSAYTEVLGGRVRFRERLENVELTKAERVLAELLVGGAVVEWPEIRTALEEARFGAPLISKQMYSPVLHVDKAAGRGKYTYRLVGRDGKIAAKSTSEEERYEKFRGRLRVLVAAGSDVDVETLRRREQGVLREYVRGEGETGTCAICGVTFEVSALHAAHKKPRALCSESERADPHIVMPLCVFGCDYLYENKHLRVNGATGQVVATMSALPQESASVQRLGVLAERIVDERWLRGERAYFDN